MSKRLKGLKTRRKSARPNLYRKASDTDAWPGWTLETNRVYASTRLGQREKPKEEKEK